MLKLGLIGYPVNHSLSPWIHQQFMKKANITGTYKLYEIKENQFSTKIEKIMDKLQGFNVTLPYKQKIIPYLDRLDESAKLSCAVNTVVKKNEKWIGYNTDGIGYVKSLFKAFPTLNNKDIKVLILGAGGAARGIYYALLLHGITSIDLANRTKEKAKDIIKQSSNTSNVYSLTEIEQNLGHYDLIIQTTSVGMKPKEKDCIISIRQLKEHTIVSDIVYQPLMTKFLTLALKEGARIHQGHTMLLYQALYAFEIWTNKKLSTYNLEQKLEEKLKGS